MSAERGPEGTAERSTKGGVLLSVNEGFNFAFADSSVIDALKTRLKRDGRYPIGELLPILGIATRIRWPKSLDNAEFVFDKQLQREWTATGIGMRANYAKFLPDVVVPFWRQL